VRNKHPYIIPFIGLKLGVHHFDFQAEETFFQDFEFSEVSQGQFRFDVTLEKKSTMMEITMVLSGSTTVPCDRCGDEMELTLEGTDHWVIKWGEETEDELDDVWIFGPKEHFVDIRQRMYELIHLSLPVKRAHEEGACNPDVMAAMEKYRAEQDSDTQWISLKNMEMETPLDLSFDDDDDEDEE
jgi:uncharacterized metal-binding protein YceD (DUF177 family)